MNIRRIIRLSCLSVMGFFWASCGSDSDSSTGVTGVNPGLEPESSSDDAVTSSSSSEETLSSAKEESSSSSEAVPESSATEASSSSVASLSSEGKYILASDTSVTCDAIYEPSQTCITYYTCEDYQKYLGSDTTIAESLLMLWENRLEKCDFVHSNVALYGVMYKARRVALVQKTLSVSSVRTTALIPQSLLHGSILFSIPWRSSNRLTAIVLLK